MILLIFLILPLFGFVFNQPIFLAILQVRRVSWRCFNEEPLLITGDSPCCQRDISSRLYFTNMLNMLPCVGGSFQHASASKSDWLCHCQLIKCYYSYFQCHLLLFVCFITWLKVNSELTSDCWLCILLCNLHQRGTSRHTVSASELCAKALLESWWSRMCIMCWVHCKGAEFFGKQTNEQAYKHPTL